MCRMIFFFGIFIAMPTLAWIYGATLDEIQVIVLFLTGLTVIWYTYETYVLRIETQRQTELSQKPFVIISHLENKSFSITNIGNGPALNINIKKVVLAGPEDPIYVRFRNPTILLQPDGKSEIMAESFHGNNSAGDFFLANLDPVYTNSEASIEIEFQDIGFKKYTSVQKVLPGKWEITGISSA